MATLPVRVHGILDAQVNRVVSDATIDRVGAAIAFNRLQSTAYAAMSNADKLRYIIDYYLVHTKDLVRSAESASGKTQVDATTAASVNTDFAETQ